MSRQYRTNGRRRDTFLPGTRVSRSRLHLDDTYQEKSQKKRKRGAKIGVTTATNVRRRQAAMVVTADDESTTSGNSEADEDNNDDDDADGDDESDEPEVKAPSRASKKRKAGVLDFNRSMDDSDGDDSDFDMFPDEVMYVEPGDELFLGVDDDDDYDAVNDIPDSDPDDADQAEEDYLQQHLQDEVATTSAFEDSDGADPSFYLNQIEGMSEFGFGETEDSEGTAGFDQGSHEGNETLHRHVRFEDHFPEARGTRLDLSESPTMMRALLPSALPNATISEPHPAKRHESESESESGSDADSDLTEVDEEFQAAHAGLDEPEELEEPKSRPDSRKKAAKSRGPPCGKFIDDGSKPSGILDPTGRTLIITNAASLGPEFARRYGPSAPASPETGFADAVFDDEQSPDSAVGVDTVANSADAAVAAAAAVPEVIDDAASLAAFDTVINPDGSQPSAEDWKAAFMTVFGNFEDSDQDDPEESIRIEDIVSFDSDSDESATSPVFAEHVQSTPSPYTARLNPGIVTAFRKNQDSVYYGHEGSAFVASSPLGPPFSHHDFTTPKTRPSRKRKARTDSPYGDAHYKGVTPVQRTSGNHTRHILNTSPVVSNPVRAGGHKRQRLS